MRDKKVQGIVLVGPTCSGKTFQLTRLLETGLFQRVVSHTTRLLRPGEINGISYHGVTVEEFRQTPMLEYVERKSGLYGQARSSWNSLGQGPILINDITIEGADALRGEFPGRIGTIYLDISAAVLEERYRNARVNDGEIDQADLDDRLRLREIEQHWAYDQINEVLSPDPYFTLISGEPSPADVSWHVNYALEYWGIPVPELSLAR